VWEAGRASARAEKVGFTIPERGALRRWTLWAEGRAVLDTRVVASMAKYLVGVMAAWSCGLGLAGCSSSSEDDGSGGTAGAPVSVGGARPAGTGGSGGTTPSGTGGAASPPPSGGNASKPVVMVTDQYGYTTVSRDNRGYIVQNNVWGAGAQQTLTVQGTSFEVTMQTGTNGTSGAPVSYPSVFIGSNYDRATLSSGLPKQVSALGKIDTMWSHNAGSQMGTYNASYDVWFSTNAMGDGQAPSGGYLMVWFYDPANAQPIGSVQHPNVSIPGVMGTWDVWIGPNAGKPCISYVAKQPISSMTFDLNLFIQDAVKNRPNTIQAGWYLTNVFAGFEIWSGGVGLKTNDFYVVVN